MNFCANCGNKLEGDERVCPNCGTIIKDNSMNANVMNEVKQDNNIGNVVVHPTVQFYDTNWFAIVMLVFLWPIGLCWMWIREKWSLRARIFVTLFFAVVICAGILDKTM